MDYNSKTFFISLTLTTVFLLLSDVLVSSLFPLVGFENLRVSCLTIIILYLSFYFNNLLIAPLIAYFYFVHGIFSVEHWSVGALSCLTVSILISSLRNVIHLSNYFVTFVFVQLFQIVIFFISSLIIYLKLDSSESLLESFYLFLPESIIISFISPMVFNLLHKIWFRSGREMEGAES